MGDDRIYYLRYLADIAAIFFAAAYSTVQPGYGDQYNNEAIAACVMGGTSMIGGWLPSEVRSSGR